MMHFKHALKFAWLLVMLVLTTSVAAQDRVTGTIFESDGKGENPHGEVERWRSKKRPQP